MPNSKNRKIRADNFHGFETVTEEDYDPATHELLVGEDEIVVKPLNVDEAKPFVIGEKDFDPRSYERVRQTRAVAEEIAKQADRQTLTEEIESRQTKA